MTDKEIKAEIEKWLQQKPFLAKNANDAYVFALEQVLRLIDDMQEGQNLSNLERNGENWKDAFEQEWQRYFEHRGEVATVNIKDLARHFANWQREP